jgi:hypothetical protein
MANSSAVIYGEALLYTTPHHEKNDFPDADTINYGTDWGTPPDQPLAWRNLGYTQDGINLGMTVDRDTIGADQVLDPLFRPITGRDVTISSNLIEFTGANLQFGLGQGEISDEPAGPSERGYTEFDLTASVSDRFDSIGIDVQQPADGEPLRAIMWKGLASGGVDATFGNRATAAQIPVEFMAVPDDSTTPTRIFTLRDYIPALAGSS